jgi:hypothetical protein
MTDTMSANKAITFEESRKESVEVLNPFPSESPSRFFSK